MNRAVALTAVPIPGLPPVSLGNYLASLGLLRVMSWKWPKVRAAWKDERFHLVGGPVTLAGIIDHACGVAKNTAWTPYEQQWSDAQKASTKSKSGAPLARWLAVADESRIEMFSAHAVATRRVHFNPLLGTGGNAGKRRFADGWRRAIDALATAKEHVSGPELEALLRGETLTWHVEKLNAASWFSDANKMYNSGQSAFREGAISPWAMALACEGLSFFAGSASRRLGSQTHAAGAFPFVTRSTAPSNSGEAGHDLAEVWAPLWDRPMTVREAVTLFSRGRAEIGGRGALTPSAFAVAIVRRGVDAGVTEFRRFVLGRTTSANTFESRFEGAVRVQHGEAFSVQKPLALDSVLDLTDQLPRDRKVGGRWRFVGLRGPIESALVRAAGDPQNSEAAASLLDAVMTALDRIDRNRSFRERNIRWNPLPLNWLPVLFSERPTTEARLALACVSSFPTDRPFTLYRYGVEWQWDHFTHTTNPPMRWVWRAAPIAAILSDVLGRSVLDWQSDSKVGARVRSYVPACGARIGDWLSGDLDEDLLTCWLSRFALFDWRFVPPAVRTLASRDSNMAASGALSLFGLLQPLFDLTQVRVPGISEDLLPLESGARTAGAARQVVGLIRTNQIDAAIRSASARYAMAGVPIIRNSAPWAIRDPERLIASLLFGIFERDGSALIGRWLRPQRREGESTHA